MDLDVTRAKFARSAKPVGTLKPVGTFKSVGNAKSVDTIDTANGTSKCARCACTISSAIRLTSADRMNYLCIPCKRSVRQKEKEAWLALPEKSNPAELVKLVDADVETNETLLSIANKALVSRLECPVCYQLMIPPVRQCRNGHSICSRCNVRLNRCPTCRRSFIDTSNVVLNEICLVVAIPCRYYQDGCRQLVRLVDKADHEKECLWKQYDCPEDSNCGWKGSQADLVDHVSKEHSGSISRVVLGRNTSLRYTYGPIHPVEEASEEVEHFNTVSRTVLLLDETGDARQVFVFNVKYDTVSGSLCGVLRYIGSKQDASNFSYKVKLVSPDESFKISTTTFSVGYDVNVDDVITSGCVMKVDGQVFKKFVTEEGKFFVSIKIIVRDELTKQDK